METNNRSDPFSFVKESCFYLFLRASIQIIMNTLRMADIQAQYHRLRPEIDAAVAAVLESGEFINGKEVPLFSRELSDWMGGTRVIPCANGTDALQVALMALDLEPGDEVITTNFTFISTVEVLVLLRLKPVLADVDPTTFNIDATQIRSLITPRTRALIPAHLFGQPADMDPILAIARENNLVILEDNAQSLGATYRHSDGSNRMAGDIGLLSTTSFFPTKPLACYGDGGAIMTRDAKLAEKLAMIVNHGAKVKYHHEIIGVNSRLDTLQAAILRVNLRHLNSFIEARQAVARHYDQLLEKTPGLRVPATGRGCSHVYHQYTLVLEEYDRDKVQQQLKEAGIPAMIYYPVPLSLQRAFASAGYREGDFPVTERLCRQVLSLPVHTEMTPDQIEYIASSLKKTLT